MVKNKGRDMDVYVGIDVFGRGCLGGGGYNIVEVRVINSSRNIYLWGYIKWVFFYFYEEEVWLFCNY